MEKRSVGAGSAMRARLGLKLEDRSVFNLDRCDQPILLESVPSLLKEDGLSAIVSVFQKAIRNGWVDRSNQRYLHFSEDQDRLRIPYETLWRMIQLREHFRKDYDLFLKYFNQSSLYFKRASVGGNPKNIRVTDKFLKELFVSLELKEVVSLIESLIESGAGTHLEKETMRNFVEASEQKMFETVLDEVGLS